MRRVATKQCETGHYIYVNPAGGDHAAKIKIINGEVYVMFDDGKMLAKRWLKGKFYHRNGFYETTARQKEGK